MQLTEYPDIVLSKALFGSFKNQKLTALAVHIDHVYCLDLSPAQESFYSCRVNPDPPGILFINYSASNPSEIEIGMPWPVGNAIAKASTLSTRLEDRFYCKMLKYLGTDSKEYTLPYFPTFLPRVILVMPTFAPTSINVIPVLTVGSNNLASPASCRLCCGNYLNVSEL
jgi:hypothetical protein